MSVRCHTCAVLSSWLLAVALVIAGLPGCNSKSAVDAEQSDSPATEASLSARVVTVGPGHWPSVVRTQGTLIADEVTIVGTKVGGRVAAVHFDLGDAVDKDTPLVTLDQTEFHLQIAHSKALLLQARAAMGLAPDSPLASLTPEKSPPVLEASAVWDEARTRVDRWRRLREQGAVTEEEYEQSLAAEKVAAARYSSALNSANERMAQIAVQTADLALAQQRLDDSITPAPFAGLVQQRHVAPGTFVQVGHPLMTLVRTDTLRFRGTVPERHAHRVALGQTVILRLEATSEPYEVKVTRISPTIDEMSRALLFEAEVDNRDGELRSGMFGEAELVIDPDAQSLVIHQSAVTEFAGAEKVWKVVDGFAQEHVVETGRRRDGTLEILSGLISGDLILLDADLGRVAKIAPLSGELPEEELPIQNAEAATESSRVAGG